MLRYIAPQRKQVYHRVAQATRFISPTTLGTPITDHICLPSNTLQNTPTEPSGYN